MNRVFSSGELSLLEGPPPPHKLELKNMRFPFALPPINMEPRRVLVGTMFLLKGSPNVKFHEKRVEGQMEPPRFINFSLRAGPSKSGNGWEGNYQGSMLGYLFFGNPGMARFLKHG